MGEGTYEKLEVIRLGGTEGEDGAAATARPVLAGVATVASAHAAATDVVAVDIALEVVDEPFDVVVEGARVGRLADHLVAEHVLDGDILINLAVLLRVDKPDRDSDEVLRGGDYSCGSGRGGVRDGNGGSHEGESDGSEVKLHFRMIPVI